MLGSVSFSLWRAVVVFCKQRPYMWRCYHNSASWLPRLGLCLVCRSQDQTWQVFFFYFCLWNALFSTGIFLCSSLLQCTCEHVSATWVSTTTILVEELNNVIIEGFGSTWGHNFYIMRHAEWIRTRNLIHQIFDSPLRIKVMALWSFPIGSNAEGIRLQ